MEMQKSKVYVLLDSSGYITRIDGGYTESNITDLENWVLIDEGYGDRYNLCQGNYFPQPIITDDGIYRWKYENKKCVLRTNEEIEADRKLIPEPKPTTEEKISELEAQNEMLLECLLEMSEIIYA